MGKSKKIGDVTHYYDKLQVGIVRLDADLKVGDTIHFKGATTDFEQAVEDMQFDHKDVTVGVKGQEVGIKVSERVRDGDDVFAV